MVLPANNETFLMRTLITRIMWIFTDFKIGKLLSAQICSIRVIRILLVIHLAKHLIKAGRKIISANKAAKIVNAHNNPKTLTDTTPLNPTTKNPQTSEIVVENNAPPV